MRRSSIFIFLLVLVHYINGQDAFMKPVLFSSVQNILELQPAPLPVTHHRLVVIAHRGSHLEVPENTLAAYANAIKEGADYVEIDLRTSKDGHLVIMHDESVTKMTGEKGLIKELTYSQIRALKINALSNEDTNTYRVPDFAGVLDLCKGKINIYLDFKDADVEKSYQLIQDAGMQQHVVVYLNKKEQYGQWRKVAPQIPLMSSLPENMDSLQLNDLLHTMRLEVVDNAYEKDKISFVHERKMAIWLDVQSKDEGPAKWDKVIKKGVDGLQTDHPAKLVKYLEEQGIR